MALEIEIKLKIDHLAPVRDRLRHLGATRLSEVLETNIFFDTADRVLLGSDCGLRLRCSRDVHSHSDRLAISFKGPRGEGPVKTREEIEMIVDTQEAAIDLLARLGYDVVLTFEKHRESWLLDRCKIELDSLPELGSFVEIECPTQADVLRVQEKLGLSNVEGILQTYPDLVAHHLSDRGARETKLTFR
jgi:predicted adenylyl cyclase CyaB